MDEKEDEDLLKVKAMMWEVKEGKPTKLKALGIIWVPKGESVIETKKPEQESLELYPDREEKTYELTRNGKKLENFEEEAKDKGRMIDRLGTNSVFENILADVKEGMSRNEETNQLIARVVTYYPDAKPSSHGVYLSVHRRYLKGERSKPDKYETGKDKGERITTEVSVPIFTNVLEKIKLCGTDFREMEKVISEYYDMKEKSIRRYVYGYRKYIGGDIAPKQYNTKLVTKKRRMKRKPKGSLGKDDTYNIWIMSDEHSNVKKAINKWGFIATTESIADITGLKMGRVRAILHWMLKKHEIYISRDKLTPIYRQLPPVKTGGLLATEVINSLNISKEKENSNKQV